MGAGELECALRPAQPHFSPPLWSHRNREDRWVAIHLGMAWAPLGLRWAGVEAAVFY